MESLLFLSSPAVLIFSAFQDSKRPQCVAQQVQVLFSQGNASYPTYFELYGYPTSNIQPIQTNDIVCKFEAGILTRNLKIHGLKCQQCPSIAFESEGREDSMGRKYLPRVGLEWKEGLRNSWSNLSPKKNFLENLSPKKHPHLILDVCRIYSAEKCIVLLSFRIIHVRKGRFRTKWFR